MHHPPGTKESPDYYTHKRITKYIHRAHGHTIIPPNLSVIFSDKTPRVLFDDCVNLRYFPTNIFANIEL